MQSLWVLRRGTSLVSMSLFSVRILGVRLYQRLPEDKETVAVEYYSIPKVVSHAATRPAGKGGRKA